MTHACRVPVQAMPWKGGDDVGDITHTHTYIYIYIHTHTRTHTYTHAEYLCKRDAMQKGDTVGDISRLFIYYVGRKADQVRFKETGPMADSGVYACCRVCRYVVCTKKYMKKC